MTTNSLIKKHVMRRVRIIHTLAPFISGEALFLFLLAASFIGIARDVALVHVFANTPNALNAVAFEQFWLIAFEHTKFVVQILTVTALMSLIFLVHTTGRFVASTFRTASA